MVWQHLQYWRTTHLESISFHFTRTELYDFRNTEEV